MEGLQRSEVSFRRQGSSGLVWDDKFLSGELNKISTTTAAAAARDQSDNKQQPPSSANYRTVNVEPADEPPSPRVSGCCVCSVFGKNKSSAYNNFKSDHHQKRENAGRRPPHHRT